ncbi:hypothetical protein ILYODFUR_009959 [Ilyodon furcidens]|uniref:Uncharacterized protein n=1 Tax=Ilyodon furcidens TaxID=33524 RepID=A0ABV0VCP7_9TELE
MWKVIMESSCSSVWEDLRATASVSIHRVAEVCVAERGSGPPARYSGHLEQPHSRAVSISSEYEVPSVQRKTTFLLLVFVTPQQTPGGADAWQDLGQFMRGILLVDVHVLMAWWRFSCSLNISPLQLSSAWMKIQTLQLQVGKFTFSVKLLSLAACLWSYLCHRWVQ